MRIPHPAPLFLGGVALAMIGVSTACGDDQPTVVPSATPTATIGEDGVVVPPPSREGVPPAPDDWVAYECVETPDLAFRHPRDWFVDCANGQLFSFDPEDAPTQESFVEDGLKVQVSCLSASRGAIPLRPDGAGDVSVGEWQGWEVVKLYDGGIGTVKRTHAVVLEHAGIVCSLGALFEDRDEGGTVFLQLLESAALD
jgi:hypothetical protein